MSRRDQNGYTLTQIMILDQLKTVGSMTITEVAKEIGRGKEVTRHAMYDLHARGKVYISSWPYVGVQRARMWSFKTISAQVDKPKPEPLKNTEYQKNYRNRNRGKLAIKRSNRVGNPFAGLILGV